MRMVRNENIFLSVLLSEGLLFHLPGLKQFDDLRLRYGIQFGHTNVAYIHAILVCLPGQAEHYRRMYPDPIERGLQIRELQFHPSDWSNFAINLMLGCADKIGGRSQYHQYISTKGAVPRTADDELDRRGAPRLKLRLRPSGGSFFVVTLALFAVPELRAAARLRLPGAVCLPLSPSHSSGPGAFGLSEGRSGCLIYRRISRVMVSPPASMQLGRKVYSCVSRRYSPLLARLKPPSAPASAPPLNVVDIRPQLAQHGGETQRAVR